MKLNFMIGHYHGQFKVARKDKFLDRFDETPFEKTVTHDDGSTITITNKVHYLPKYMKEAYNRWNKGATQ